MAQSITPIVAKFHYDDIGQEYTMKVTRQTFSVTEGYKFEEILEKAHTLLELINLLYQLWAILASSPGTTRNAPPEDLAAHLALLTAGTVGTSDILSGGTVAGPGVALT